MKKQLFATIIALCTLIALNATAYAQPEYDDFSNVVSFNATANNANGVTAENISGRPGETVEIRMPNGSFEIDENTSMGKVSVKINAAVQNASFTLNKCTPSTKAPAGTIATFCIETTIPDAAIEEVTIQFIVDGVYVNVKLHRLSGNNWAALPTELTDKQGTSNWYSATSPGFSSFAITAEKAKSDSSKLPFTGGLPLYIVGALGALLIVSGLTLKSVRR